MKDDTAPTLKNKLHEEPEVIQITQYTDQETSHLPNDNELIISGQPAETDIPKLENTGQSAETDIPKLENTGQRRRNVKRQRNNQNGQSNTRNETRSPRQTQRMLAALASKSEVVEDVNAQQFSSINPQVTFKSHTLIRFLSSELQNIMAAAADVIPFIQVTQRHEDTRGKFDAFTAESIALVKQICSTQAELIDIINQDDVRIKQRLQFIEMSDPREFKFVFLNEFFWDYIVMLGDADNVLHSVEKIILTGIYKDEMEQVRSDIINSVRSAFRALEYISKLRTRRDAGSPIKLDQFRKIQTNFRHRMDHIAGLDVVSEAEGQETDSTAA